MKKILCFRLDFGRMDCIMDIYRELCYYLFLFEGREFIIKLIIDDYCR